MSSFFRSNLQIRNQQINMKYEIKQFLIWTSSPDTTTNPQIHGKQIYIASYSIENKKCSQIIYQKMLDRQTKITGFEKWKMSLGITKTEWLDSFRFLKLSCKDTKLQWFQFRINHNILTTNLLN